MATDLEILMDLDPLKLSTKPGTEGCRNLDAIIAWHRNNRAASEEAKAKGKRAPSAKGKLDIMSLIQGMKPKEEAAPKALGSVSPPKTGLRRL